MKTNLI